MVHRPHTRGSIDRCDAARTGPVPQRPRPANPSRARSLLTSAGLRSGHRILDLGAVLYDRDMSLQELTEFRVLGLREDASAAVGGQLQPVRDSASFRFTVPSLSGVELGRASFDGVVALDWCPSGPLEEVVDTWRRVLVPDGGVAIVTGTEVRPQPETGDGAGPAAAGRPSGARDPRQRYASHQWIDQLTTAGFRMEAVTDERAAPQRYHALADDLELISEQLRGAMGAGPADSYLRHVGLLDDAARHGRARRYEIVARL